MTVKRNQVFDFYVSLNTNKYCRKKCTKKFLSNMNKELVCIDSIIEYIVCT